MAGLTAGASGNGHWMVAIELTRFLPAPTRLRSPCSSNKHKVVLVPFADTGFVIWVATALKTGHSMARRDSAQGQSFHDTEVRLCDILQEELIERHSDGNSRAHAERRLSYHTGPGPAGREVQDMRRATALATAVLALVLSTGVSADIPEFMAYQGVLRDVVGNPVPDGSYDVTFRLYDVATGGTALWVETQMLAAADGIINAQLGAVAPLNTLDFDVPYWLGISVEGEAELSPRTALASVPYAAHAGFADTALDAGDDDWAFSGDDIFRAYGNVGIGQGAPAVRLHVTAGDEGAARFENASTDANFTLRASNDIGTAGAFFGGVFPSSYPTTPAAVYGQGGAGVRGAHFASLGSDGIYSSSPNGKAIWAESTGNYAGYFTGGGWGVYVQDQLEVGSFRMQSGASTGYVLTSNSGGDGTWQPIAAGSDGDWTIAGSDMYSGVSGRVGIGDSAPSAKLEVRDDTAVEALEVLHDGISVSRVANIERNTTALQNQDLLQLKVPTGSDYLSQFIECERGGTVEFSVDGDGYVNSNEGGEFNGNVDVNGIATITGEFNVSSNSELPAEFATDYLSSSTRVISAVATGSGASDVVGVYGESVPMDWYGVGGSFKGGFRGVEGTVEATGAGGYIGVFGRAAGGTGDNYGVYGEAWGEGANYAGYFAGDVVVAGTLYGGTPAVRIDHPLNPEGRYLTHAGVESDELLNVYSGNATLDAQGEATVVMPNWFEALNQDYRYQLTCVGGFAPVYIAETIEGNRFSIAGGEPGMVVSWQVTGVRHDAYAAANPVVVESDKRPDKVGKYLHPEVFGRPASAGIHYQEPRDRGVSPSRISVPEPRVAERAEGE
jgi:hypothetical protein